MMFLASLLFLSPDIPVVSCPAVSFSVYVVLLFLLSATLGSSSVATVNNICSSIDGSTGFGIPAVDGVPCCSTFLVLLSGS
jgi:hypothetical protein